MGYRSSETEGSAEGKARKASWRKKGWAGKVKTAGPGLQWEPGRTFQGLVRREPRGGGLGRSPESLRVPEGPRSASPPPLLCVSNSVVS